MAKGNWVDRGDALETTLARVLSFAVQRKADDPAILPHVLTIRGLVEAGSTEVHVTGYLRTVTASFGQPEIEPMLARTLAIALWHIANVGLVRDRAMRERAAVLRTLPPAPPLATQLHDAILRAPTVTTTLVPPRIAIGPRGRTRR